MFTSLQMQVANQFFERFDKNKVEIDVYKKFGLQNYLLFVSRREPRKII